MSAHSSPPSGPPSGPLPVLHPEMGMEGMPMKFGKYTLIRKLAAGGMAELFLALQKSVAGFEKLLVIKRILPAMNQDKAFIDMLLQEARIAATLSHPNIVQIFDVGQAEGQFFIAMEHVHGEDLRSIVRQMKKKGIYEFPLEHALQIVLGMCAGLSYAHEKRDLDGTELHIVHRDISPQNVVVTFTGDVKIVDFGIAKSDSRVGEATKSGKLKGKVPYMSPEQARGEEIDARSDVFASGVMLFELTTGKRLFKGTSEYETLKLICEKDYPRPSDVRDDYPEGLEPIVMKALEKNPNDRYQSAREMQADVEAYVRRTQLAVSSLVLNQFMQGLFEDRLREQKEALLQGKQLADIIEMQHALTAAHPDASMAIGALDSSRMGSPSSPGYAGGASESSSQRPATNSMPAAARTVTDVNAQPHGKRGTGLALALGGGLLALAVVGGGIGFVVATKKDAADQTPTAKSAEPAAPKGTLAVESTPSGASVWINGDLRAEKTPATIVNLPVAMPLDVKVTMDGFEQVKHEVTLAADKPGKVTAELRKGSVVVEVKVLPEGTPATITLDGKPSSGPRIDGVSSGVSHTLLVTAPGFKDATLSFNGSPQETKHLDVTLEKAPDIKHGTNPARATAQPVVAAGSGKLNVGASGGWCNVIVDGVARGATPVAGVELSAGAHKVTCTTADGKTQSATVAVPADGTARHKFTL